VNLNSEKVTNGIDFVIANIIMSSKQFNKILDKKKIADRLLVSKSNTIILHIVFYFFTISQ